MFWISIILFTQLVRGITSQQTPDVKNKTLILSVAELAANAYVTAENRNYTKWRNTTGLFTYDSSYGWSVDGLRGHIFRHREEAVIVVSVKGTTLDSGKDKESANLICSCSCCFSNCTGTECDRDKLQETLPSMYYTMLLQVYEELVTENPGFSIWFTGHSMGGVIASLAAQKTCHPAIVFSAPGEQLFADRIGLEHKCEAEHEFSVHHVGYYKDPIFKGTCNWLCKIAGYRMESKCHHGTECLYEPEEEDNYKENVYIPQIGFDTYGSTWITTHSIAYFIDKIIAPSDSVPECIPVKNCTETCSET